MIKRTITNRKTGSTLTAKTTTPSHTEHVLQHMFPNLTLVRQDFVEGKVLRVNESNSMNEFQRMQQVRQWRSIGWQRGIESGLQGLDKKLFFVAFEDRKNMKSPPDSAACSAALKAFIDGFVIDAKIAPEDNWHWVVGNLFLRPRFTTNTTKREGLNIYTYVASRDPLGEGDLDDSNN